MLVRRESQDFKDQVNFDSSGGYVYTLEKLVNGKLKTVKTEHRSEEDVFGGDPAIRIN